MNTQTLSLLAALSLLPLTVRAGADPTPVPSGPWKTQVVTKGTLNQAHFDNWSQGGDDTVAWQAGLYASFDRNGERGLWKNTFRSVYGRTKTSESRSVKSTDELFLESVYSLKWKKWVNPFVARNLLTQMDKGYKTVEGDQVQTSQFMDPGYLTQSAGIAYDDLQGFTTRLGAAVKETVTSRFNSYADDPKTLKVEKTRVEPGVNWVTEYKAKISAQSLFTTKLDFFSNLKNSKEIYSRWGNMLTVKATKFLDVNAEFELLYDGHVSTRRQIRQVMGLGLSYSIL